MRLHNEKKPIPTHISYTHTHFLHSVITIYLGSFSDRMFSRTTPSKYSSRVSLKVAEQYMTSVLNLMIYPMRIWLSCTEELQFLIAISHFHNEKHNFNTKKGHEMT